jgi:hypothetical protein
MRHFAGAVLLAWIPVFIGCGRSAQDDIITANKALDNKLIHGFMEKDLNAVMQCWWKSPDVRNYPADNLNGQLGWEAIREATRFSLDATERVLSIEVRDERYVVHCDAVVGSGVIAMRMIPKGSPQEIELTFRYTDVRERKGGEWLYVYNHESMLPLAGGLEPTVARPAMNDPHQ